MPTSSSRTGVPAPSTLRRPLLLAALFTLLLPSLAASSHPTVVRVPAPNRVDDTASLQAALDSCVQAGPGCTVQLAAGRYLTRQLVAYGFHGTFKGQGSHLTVIEALPNLPVTVTDYFFEGACPPNVSTCLWPSLILFVDGSVRVSDLAIHVHAAAGTATAPWMMGGSPYTSLIDALRFMGRSPGMTVEIDDISIEGVPDESPTSIFGYNVVNGIIFTGEFPRSSVPFDYYFMAGTMTVQKSHFRTLFNGVAMDGFIRDSRVVIGGSPAAGNFFDACYYGIDIEASERSEFTVAYNRARSIGYGILVEPWIDVFVPSAPSNHVIHDNEFVTSGPDGEGIVLYNALDSPWIRALIYNNDIRGEQTLFDGIGTYYVKDVAIFNNTISGTGVAAVGLRGSTTDTAAVFNHVSGFTPVTGSAHYVLRPLASGDLVICSNREDTVLDLGSGNQSIRCTKVAP